MNLVGEPYNHYNMEVFLLEAKAVWEHTCIAGGLLVFFAPFFARFTLKNHNILWYNRPISSYHHNTSSEQPSPHAHFPETYRTQPLSPPDTPSHTAPSNPSPV